MTLKCFAKVVIGLLNQKVKIADWKDKKKNVDNLGKPSTFSITLTLSVAHLDFVQLLKRPPESLPCRYISVIPEIEMCFTNYYDGDKSREMSIIFLVLKRTKKRRQEENTAEQ